MDILAHIATGTPGWVVILFFALMAYGLSQLRDRQLNLARLALMPLAMAALSIYGVAADFGAQPLHVAAWLLGAAPALGAMLRRPLPRPRFSGRTVAAISSWWRSASCADSSVAT